MEKRPTGLAFILIFSYYIDIIRVYSLLNPFPVPGVNDARKTAMKENSIALECL